MDLTNITPKADDFSAIADTIMNDYVLSVKGDEYRICEIEFYLKDKDHNDEYVHGDKDQSKYGVFYFHKYKTGTYKSGTYKGMDMTFGNKDSFYGILIRSIMNVSTNEFIEGPCKCVNEILGKYDCTTVYDFMTDKEALNIFNNTQDLIIKKKTQAKIPLYKGSRIGLSDKYPDYKDRQYRFVINRDKIKKEKSKLVPV